METTDIVDHKQDFLVQYSDHFSNTKPFNNRTQIYLLVWLSSSAPLIVQQSYQVGNEDNRTGRLQHLKFPGTLQPLRGQIRPAKKDSCLSSPGLIRRAGRVFFEVRLSFWPSSRLPSDEPL